VYVYRNSLFHGHSDCRLEADTAQVSKIYYRSIDLSNSHVQCAFAVIC
jgi:hypothetical protein